MMNFEPYKTALKQTVEPHIYTHSLALQACVGGLYDYFVTNNRLDDTEPSRDFWLLAGLMHDVDFSGDTKEQHPLKTREVMTKLGLDLPVEVEDMIKTHAPEITEVKPSNKAQWSIFCADSLTGLITATALVYPSKKLADVKLSSVTKRLLKEPRFAAGTRREEIKMCELSEGLNLKLETFCDICLKAMQAVASDLGL